MECPDHNTMNCYRSAISDYYEKLAGAPIGKNDKVCKLLTGICNRRTPQSKYYVSMGCVNSD